MPQYIVNVGEKKYKVTADSPDNLPEIVDTISVKSAQPKQEPERNRLTQVLSSSEKIDSGDPVVDALLFAQKEVLAPINKGFNAAAFGLPRYIMNKANPNMADEVYAEQSTLGGKTRNIGGQAVGMIYGGAGKLGAGVASKILPQAASKIGLNAPVGAIAAFKRAKMMGDIGRGAIQGAVASGTQILDENTTLEQQAIQAAGGGVVGGALGGVLGKVGTKTRIGKKIGDFKKIEDRSLLTKISEVRKSGSQATAKQIKDLKDSMAQSVRGTYEAVKTNNQVLEKKLGEAISGRTYDVQKGLTDFARATSETYGNHLDEISEILASRGKNISSKDVVSSIDEAVSQIKEMGIQSDKIDRVVKTISSKYSKIDGDVSFKDFITDMKSIKSNLSSGVKTGSSRLTPEDVALTSIVEKMGKAIESVSPEYRVLNQDYGKSANAIRMAYRAFQPKQGELGGKSGAALLKRLSSGKASAQDEALIKFLEEGTSIKNTPIKGVGDVSSDIRSIGGMIKANKEGARLTAQKLKLDTLSKIDKTKEARMIREASLDRLKRRTQDIGANVTKYKTSAIREGIRTVEHVAIGATLATILNALRGK